jgi:lipoate-protein ligase A
VDRSRPGQRPRETIEELSSAIVAGCAGLGILASFGGKNDLEVASRKIAGLGLFVDAAGAMLFHASVLADLDVAFMLQVLQIPAAKLADRAGAAVSERITTVSVETGVRHDAATIRPFIADGFAKLTAKSGPTPLPLLPAGTNRSPGWANGASRRTPTARRY